MTVGPRGSEFLNKKNIDLADRHWIGEEHTLPLAVEAKIRYRQIDPAKAILKNVDGKWSIDFEDEQWAVAPGQVIVAYLGDECIGSGIIE